MKKTLFIKNCIIGLIIGITVGAFSLVSEGYEIKSSGNIKWGDNIAFMSEDLYQLNAMIADAEVTLNANKQYLEEIKNAMENDKGAIYIMTVRSTNAVGTGYLNFNVPEVDGYDPIVIIYGGANRSNWGAIETISVPCNGPGTYSMYVYGGNAQTFDAVIIYGKK